MANFSAAQLAPNGLGFSEGTAKEAGSEQLLVSFGRTVSQAAVVPGDGFELSFGPPAVTPTAYYKMRGAATPGPGYVTWVATGAPDFVGITAPSPIVVGSAIITDTWKL